MTLFSNQIPFPMFLIAACFKVTLERHDWSAIFKRSESSFAFVFLLYRSSLARILMNTFDGRTTLTRIDGCKRGWLRVAGGRRCLLSIFCRTRSSSAFCNAVPDDITYAGATRHSVRERTTDRSRASTRTEKGAADRTDSIVWFAEWKAKMRNAIVRCKILPKGE